MIDYERINRSKLVKASQISDSIKERFELSHIKISLNMIDDDINVELKQKEVSQELLTALKESFGIVHHSRYRIKPTPVLSGSYMDNPVSRAMVIFNFEKI